MASSFQAKGHVSNIQSDETNGEMIRMVAEEAPHGVVNDEHSLEEGYKGFQNATKKVEDALQALERMTFAIGNLNFGIQGVCIAAIVNNAVFLCSVWFICIISVLTAFPNLVALFLVGLRYRALVDLHASVLRKNEAHKIALIEKFPGRYSHGPVRDDLRYTSTSMRTPLIGEKVALFIGLVYVAISVVVAFSTLTVMCRHLEGVKK